MHSFLKKAFLFKDLNEEEFQEVLHQIQHRIITYKRGEFVYDGENFNKEMGILLKGRVEVQKYLISGKKIIVNQLRKGDVFGIATLSQDENYYITSLMTKQETAIFFIKEKELMRLLHLDQRLLKNYLSYVSERIYFLNKRIECFTHEKIKDRILYFLEGLKNKQQNQPIIKLPFSKSELADYLGISRASLYRVLSQLEKEKVLKSTGNKIIFPIVDK